MGLYSILTYCLILSIGLHSGATRKELTLLIIPKVSLKLKLESFCFGLNCPDSTYLSPYILLVRTSSDDCKASLFSMAILFKLVICFS